MQPSRRIQTGRCENQVGEMTDIRKVVSEEGTGSITLEEEKADARQHAGSYPDGHSEKRKQKTDIKYFQRWN